MSLKVSATFPASPVHETGRRTEKSPSRMTWRLARTALRSTGSACPSVVAATLRVFGAFPGLGFPLFFPLGFPLLGAGPAAGVADGSGRGFITCPLLLATGRDMPSVGT